MGMMLGSKSYRAIRDTGRLTFIATLAVYQVFLVQSAPRFCTVFSTITQPYFRAQKPYAHLRAAEIT